MDITLAKNLLNGVYFKESTFREIFELGARESLPFDPRDDYDKYTSPVTYRHVEWRINKQIQDPTCSLNYIKLYGFRLWLKKYKPHLVGYFNSAIRDLDMPVWFIDVYDGD